jgi:hypothetical protein
LSQTLDAMAITPGLHQQARKLSNRMPTIGKIRSSSAFKCVMVSFFHLFVVMPIPFLLLLLPMFKSWRTFVSFVPYLISNFSSHFFYGALSVFSCSQQEISNHKPFLLLLFFHRNFVFKPALPIADYYQWSV